MANNRPSCHVKKGAAKMMPPAVSKEK